MKYTFKDIYKSSLAIPIIGLTAIAIGFGVSNALNNKSERVITSACAGNCVSINSEGIKPDEIAIKTGEFLQINTADDKLHNFSLGDGLPEAVKKDDHETDNHHGADDSAHEHDPGIRSGNFGAGEAWKVQFKKAGTYTLHDHLNPRNRILVVVYDNK